MTAYWTLGPVLTQLCYRNLHQQSLMDTHGLTNMIKAVQHPFTEVVVHALSGGFFNGAFAMRDGSVWLLLSGL
jgi:hypothetical protein